METLKEASIIQMSKEEIKQAIIEGVALYHKPFLKPEEAMRYTNLKHTALSRRCSEFGIVKSSTGYYKKEELDQMMAGAPTLFEQQLLRRGRSNSRQ